MADFVCHALCILFLMHEIAEINHRYQCANSFRFKLLECQTSSHKVPSFSLLTYVAVECFMTPFVYGFAGF